MLTRDLSVVANIVLMMVLVLVLVLVLVKIRQQRAVLITPVCPMSYGRSAISRLLKISSEPASATAAGRLFQTGIVR